MSKTPLKLMPRQRGEQPELPPGCCLLPGRYRDHLVVGGLAVKIHLAQAVIIGAGFRMPVGEAVFLDFAGCACPAHATDLDEGTSIHATFHGHIIIIDLQAGCPA